MKNSAAEQLIATQINAQTHITLPDSLVCSVRDQRAILFLGVGASLEPSQSL